MNKEIKDILIAIADILTRIANLENERHGEIDISQIVSAVITQLNEQVDEVSSEVLNQVVESQRIRAEQRRRS